MVLQRCHQHGLDCEHDECVHGQPNRDGAHDCQSVQAHLNSLQIAPLPPPQPKLQEPKKLHDDKKSVQGNVSVKDRPAKMQEAKQAVPKPAAALQPIPEAKQSIPQDRPAAPVRPAPGLPMPKTKSLAPKLTSALEAALTAKPSSPQLVAKPKGREP